MIFPNQFLKTLVLRAIKIYQKTFSADHGWGKIFHPYGRCKFYPSCSAYGYQAIAKYGVIRGGLLATRRIVRCHPWSHGGIDELK